MNIKDLNVFITTAKEQNLTKASRLLYMTPQGISQIIKNMESECDCGLFLRTGNGMKLSECGKHFLVYAEKMLQDYHDMRNEILHIKQKERGVVDLLSAYGILRLVTPECIEEFRRKYRATLHFRWVSVMKNSTMCWSLRSFRSSCWSMKSIPSAAVPLPVLKNIVLIETIIAAALVAYTFIRFMGFIFSGK